MPFNSDTYHANRAARDSRAALAEARDIKARALRGEAYEWEIHRIASLARSAITYARLSRLYRGRKARKQARRHP